MWWKSREDLSKADCISIIFGSSGVLTEYLHSAQAPALQVYLLRRSVSPRSCMSSDAYWCIWGTWTKDTCSEEFICIYKNSPFFDRFPCYLGNWIDLKAAADPLSSCNIWSVGFHTKFISQFPLLLCVQWKCLYKVVESQCAEQQLTKTQEYFFTNGTFQCSDCFDFQTFLWRMAGRNTAQSNLNPTAGSNSLAPQWLQSGSVQEALSTFGECFAKAWEIT